MAGRAASEGARWPRVAAAVLVIRGLVGDDAVGFSRRFGITEADLDALERGDVAPPAVPAALRAVPGVVDWSWVDGDPGRAGPSGAPPASPPAAG